MNCEWVQRNITLYLYGELADDAHHELEQHVARCQACAAELAEQREFHKQMNALPVEEPSASPTTDTPVEASIGGITSIERDPTTNTVKVQYDRVTPGSVQGAVSDPRVQDLLLYAAKSNENSGVRLNSVDALVDKTDDMRVRETLTYALRYDSNPGVRLHSLDGLGPLVKQDIRVRNAVLEALLNDSNLGVRSGALHSLEPVKTDSSVRMALEQLAQEDPSEYIRTESRRVLASMPTVY